VIYRFNAIPINIPMAFFLSNRKKQNKNILKTVGYHKDQQRQRFRMKGTEPEAPVDLIPQTSADLGESRAQRDRRVDQ
jgi:hypothetical protein